VPTAAPKTTQKKLNGVTRRADTSSAVVPLRALGDELRNPVGYEDTHSNAEGGKKEDVEHKLTKGG